MILLVVDLFLGFPEFVFLNNPINPCVLILHLTAYTMYPPLNVIQREAIYNVLQEKEKNHTQIYNKKQKNQEELIVMYV